MIALFLGGWLLQASSRRATFLINLPVAAVAAWTTRLHVPESRDTSASGSADRPGALAGGAAGREHLGDPRPARRGHHLVAAAGRDPRVLGRGLSVGRGSTAPFQIRRALS